MKVLVTGGGGFLGSEICRQLMSRGDEPVAFQRSDSPKLAALGIQVIRGSISDAEEVNRAAENVDAIIHTAAKAGIWGRYDSFYQPNVVGTKNVISACRQHGIKPLVFTSSPSVVFSRGDIEGGDESLPYPKHFDAPYPATKAASEQLVMSANGNDLKTVSLRPHFIWGPGDNHILPGLIERAIKGQLRIPGPDKLVDTIYVSNAAKAHLQALDKLISDPQAVAGKAYFISNDEPLPQKQFIGDILAAAGHSADIKTISPAIAIALGSLLEGCWKLFRLKGEPPITRFAAEQLSTAHWYDISAAKRDFGYRADVSIGDGMRLLKEAFAESHNI